MGIYIFFARLVYHNTNCLSHWQFCLHGMENEFQTTCLFRCSGHYTITNHSPTMPHSEAMLPKDFFSFFFCLPIFYNPSYGSIFMVQQTEQWVSIALDPIPLKRSPMSLPTPTYKPEQHARSSCQTSNFLWNPFLTLSPPSSHVISSCFQNWCWLIVLITEGHLVVKLLEMKGAVIKTLFAKIVPRLTLGQSNVPKQKHRLLMIFCAVETCEKPQL